MNRSLRCLLLALLMLVSFQPLFAQVAITVSFGPPALPVYEQPLCPAEGYIWTPGYWAWDEDYGDYYWVPGTWVLAPEIGFLWTPGWWGWGGNGFLFHEGYWGPQVGFYGGINYGFGYFGRGYEGGRWDGGHFFYNRSVNNVNVVNIHNVYNTTIINRETVNRVSYNGGNGGIQARPTPAEEAAAQGRHIPPIAPQRQHVQMARSNPQLRASVNQGKPPIAATERPAAFSGPHVIAAKQAGAPYHPPANRGGASPGNPARPGEVQPHPANAANPAHASELQPHQVATPPSTGNAKLDQRYLQQQQNLVAKQNLEHQQLQQRQEQEHQRATQQNFAQAQQQQMEQRHLQQTQQMEQRHTQQMQSLQTRQAGPGGGRPPR